MRSLARLCFALTFALTLGVALSAPQRASAATFTVNSLGDTADAMPGDGACADASGACTLRAAVQEANALPGSDTISFNVSGTINLTGALPTIDSPVAINGPGAKQLTVERSNVAATNFNIFVINVGVVADIGGLTITGGKGIYGGGGVQNLGTLTIDGCAITGNTDHAGGGISNDSMGTLTLRNSTVSGNSAPDFGGGINNNGDLTVVNSTISGNRTDLHGGGIKTGSSGSTLTVINSTVTGNRADAEGNNVGAGGGISTFESVVILRNTIVAGNFRGQATPVRSDLDGQFDASSSYNLIGDGEGLSGLTDGSNGNRVGSGAAALDPRLGPLADNGGPTQTHALLPDSPALDAGDAALTTDQRGLPRPADLAGVANTAGGNGSDIGALEMQPATTNTAITSVAPDPSTVGESYTIAFAVTSPAGTPVGSVTLSDGAGSCSAPLANGSGSCALTSHTVGAKTLTATYPGVSFFGGSSGTTAHQVNKGQAAVTLSNLAQTYDGTPKSVAVSTDPAGLSVAVTYARAGQAIAAPTAAGSYDVTATVTDPNYDGTASGTLVIAKASQTINFAQPADKTFGDASFALSASATSGLSVAFQVISGPATISGSTLTLTGSGSVTIKATQGGDANNNAASDVSRSFNVAKAATTTSVTVSSASYDGSSHGGSASVNGPAGFSQALPVTYTGRNGTAYPPSTQAPTGAGSYTASAAYAGDSNYSVSSDSKDFQIAKGSQTINFAAPPDKTYGDADFTMSPLASSGLAVSLSAVGNCSVIGRDIHITGAGSCALTASQSGDGNYNAAASVERSFTISKASAAVTLSNLSHTYDGMPKTARVATSPDGLPVTVTYAQNGQAMSAPTDAGAYSVTATVNDPSYGGSATGTLVIAKAATTTALASSPNPSESGQAVTFTATVASGAVTPAGAVQFRDGGANLGSPAALAGGTASLTISDLPPGAHAFTAVYSGGANFDASASAPLTQAVKPQVTISVNDVTVAEGDAGTTRANFAVTLSAASSQIVTVSYQTADGTASAGADYVATSGALTFAPGETTKVVNVLVNGDVSFEPDETFFLNLGGPTGAALARAQGVGTIVNDDARGGTVQFDLPVYAVSEGDGSLTVTVTRAGDTSGTASVAYATADDPAAVRCDDNVNNHGAAFARCDYATVVGTLTFNAGETQKSFTVPVVDDTYVEPIETFRVQLTNPTGATLGAQSTATVSILDNDVAGEPNALNGNDFFVRQQYLDFLSREPEAGQPWSATLNNCAANDPSCDRVSVSANFFRSQEFQLKGLFVFRFYKVVFGRLPLYSEIIPDMSSITGSTTAELIAKKAAYTSAFAQRQEFTNLYGAMTNQQFVDALMSRYNLQQVTTINPSSPDDTAAASVTLSRSDLVSQLTAGTLTRGQVVRAIADSTEVGAAEFNPAFVAMQYFGYLRRDPDTGGFNAWLQTINANPADFRSMVNGFMNSTEYRLRFGTP